MINRLKLILCPPTAIRAADLLTLPALSDYHPALLAALLLGTDATPLLRALARDLAHPLPQGLTEPRAADIVAWQTASDLDQLGACLAAAGGPTLAELLAPPPPEPGAVAWCPRCGGQLLAPRSECPDCPGVHLRAYSPPERTARKTS